MIHSNRIQQKRLSNGFDVAGSLSLSLSLSEINGFAVLKFEKLDSSQSHGIEFRDSNFECLKSFSAGGCLSLKTLEDSIRANDQLNGQEDRLAIVKSRQKLKSKF